MDAAASAAAAAAAADAANNPEKRRRRPPLACVACRRRKVRCDRKMPCQNCVRARRATGCTYVPDDRLEPRDGTQGFYDGINGRSNGRDDVVSAPLSTYLPENNNNNNNSSPASGAGSCAATAGTATPSGGGGGGGGAGGHHGPQQQQQQQHHRHHSHNQQQQPPLPPHEGGAPGQPVSASALADRVRQLEQQLAQVLDARTSGAAGAAGAAKSSAPSAQFLHAHPPAAGAQYLGEEHWKINDGAQTAHYMNSNPAGMASSQAMLAKSRYLGASHWMHGVTLFPPTNTLILFLDSLKSDKSSETYRAISACKAVGRSIKAARTPRLTSLSFGQHIPPRELADELLEAYFRTFEKIYRTLHVPSFRLEYGRYWQNPQAGRETFIIQLQLCMAIGAVLHDDKYSLRKDAMRWIYEARIWQLQPSEKSRISLSGLQVSCLLHVARDICGVGSDLVWASAGTLMRMALYTGMHRDPDHLPKMSLLAAEIRRRLWATILEILTQSSMESGGPPLISMDDFDTKPPGNYNDEDLLGDNESAQPPSPQPLTTFTDTSIQLALLNSIKVRLNIASYLNEFRSVPSYDKTLALNADLTTASRGLDALLRMFQSQHPGPSGFQICTAEHIVQRYFLALHFPWLGFAKNDPRYYFSRKMCVEIALRNQKEGQVHGFSALTSVRGDSNYPPDDFGRLLICASGGFRYIGTQCLLALLLELLWELEETRNALLNLTGGLGTNPPPPPPVAPAAASGTSSSATTPHNHHHHHPASTPGMGFNHLGGASSRPSPSSPAPSSIAIYGVNSRESSNDMVEVLRRSTEWLRARIRAGEVNVKGYLFGRAMVAEAEALQRGVSDEELYPLVRQAVTESAIDSLAMLREIYAEEAQAQQTAQTPGGGGGEAVYTGMDGTQVPVGMGMETGPAQAGASQGQGGNGHAVGVDGFGVPDAGAQDGPMNDWDWDVLGDPNYNFSLNLNLGAMDLILTNGFP